MDEEQIVWDEFVKTGASTVTEDDGTQYTLTSLFFWREPGNENFMVGYVDPTDGGGWEGHNIPVKALESICPGFDIEWNSAEQNHTIPLKDFSEALMDKIEAAFIAYGCRRL